MSIPHPYAPMLTVLQHIHTYTWALQGDDARKYAFEVASAASLGYISTKVMPHHHETGTRWKITRNGLTFLELHGHLIEDEELERFRDHPKPDRTWDTCGKGNGHRCDVHPDGTCPSCDAALEASTGGDQG